MKSAIIKVNGKEVVVSGQNPLNNFILYKGQWYKNLGVSK